jgi:hypothetical protein
MCCNIRFFYLGKVKILEKIASIVNIIFQTYYVEIELKRNETSTMCNNQIIIFKYFSEYFIWKPFSSSKNAFEVH